MRLLKEGEAIVNEEFAVMALLIVDAPPSHDFGVRRPVNFAQRLRSFSQSQDEVTGPKRLHLLFNIEAG